MDGPTIAIIVSVGGFSLTVAGVLFKAGQEFQKLQPRRDERNRLDSLEDHVRNHDERLRELLEQFNELFTAIVKRSSRRKPQRRGNS